MAESPETLVLEQRLRLNLARIVDPIVRDQVRAWATAWDEIAPDLRDALTELLTQQASGLVHRATLVKAQRLQASLRLVADKLDRLSAMSLVRVTSEVRDVVDQAAAAQAALVASMLPDGQDLIDLNASLPQDAADALVAIVDRTTQQITARHLPISAEAYDAVRRELIRGVAVGTSPRSTAERMVERARGGFEGGLTRAVNIARTEMLDAHRAAARVGQEQHADVLTGWVWSASLRPRTCRACLSMHGREFGLDVPGPHGHQQCRCSRTPKTKSWADLGFDGVDEPASVRPDADAYFESLTAAQQRAILGDRGYQAWLAGDYPREAWAVKRSTPGWRDSMVPSPAPGAPRRKGGSAKPPARPPAPVMPEPGDGYSMGRILGTPRQQAYVKNGERLQFVTFDKNGRPRPIREDTANFSHVYVPDAQDRATALAQYLAPAERAVKSIARAIDRGHPWEGEVIDHLVEDFRQAKTLAQGMADPGRYDLTDWVADVAGAAHRLLDRPVEPVNQPLYRGLALEEFFDPTDEDEVLRLIESLDMTDWWMRSTTPDEAIAMGYATRLTMPTQVVFQINGASGIRLESMGRMSTAPEVLVTGNISIEDYYVDSGVIWLIGRWSR